MILLILVILIGGAYHIRPLFSVRGHRYGRSSVQTGLRPVFGHGKPSRSEREKLEFKKLRRQASNKGSASALWTAVCALLLALWLLNWSMTPESILCKDGSVRSYTLLALTPNVIQPETEAAAELVFSDNKQPKLTVTYFAGSGTISVNDSSIRDPQSLAALLTKCGRVEVQGAEGWKSFLDRQKDPKAWETALSAWLS